MRETFFSGPFVPSWHQVAIPSRCPVLSALPCTPLPPHNLHLMHMCTEMTIYSTVSAAGTAVAYRPVHTHTRVHTHAPDVALMGNLVTLACAVLPFSFCQKYPAGCN